MPAWRAAQASYAMDNANVSRPHPRAARVRRFQPTARHPRHRYRRFHIRSPHSPRQNHATIPPIAALFPSSAPPASAAIPSDASAMPACPTLLAHVLRLRAPLFPPPAAGMNAAWEAPRSARHRALRVRRPAICPALLACRLPRSVRRLLCAATELKIPVNNAIRRGNPPS